MRKYAYFLIVFVFIFSFAVVSAQSFSSASFVQRQTSAPSFNSYYGSNVGTYWPILNNAEECQAREDIILQIAPGGCQPAVVRSDLLAEQNVPVFCQINALKLNPLLDIKDIRNIRFKGNYPKEVIGVGFHPARAALRTRNELLGDPLINNIGYVAVILKKQANESSLPGFAELKLQAQIEYESGNVLGIGRADFILEELSDDEWDTKKYEQSFWNGKYRVRLMDVDQAGNTATIAIYSGDRVVGTTRVGKNQISTPIYVPGSYCQAKLQVEFVGFERAQKKARIEVGSGNNTDVFDAYEGTQFLNGRCRVDKIEIDNSTLQTGNVQIRCPSGIVSLSLSPRAPNGTLVFNDTKLNNETFGNFSSSIEAYKKLVEDFPSELQANKITYGEDGLIRAIALAEQLGQVSQKFALMKLFIDNYPDAVESSNYKYKISQTYYIDSANSGHVIEMDNKYRTIRLLEVSEPKEKASAEFSYDSVLKKLEIKQSMPVSEDGKYIKLVDIISPERVIIETNCQDFLRRNSRSVNANLELGQGVSVCGKILVLKKADMKQVARIRIVPSARNTETETNLTVKIGIEKRAIKLNPEKTKERIQAINDSIKKWESINKNLGNVVSGLKAACFATSAALTIKNFFAGLSGQALARQQVMPYWNEYCKKEAGTDEAKFNSCLLEHNDEINADVNARKLAIDKVNGRIKEIQKTAVSSSTIGGKTIDTKKAAKKLAEEVKREHGDKYITMPEGRKWTLNGQSSTQVKVSDLLDDKAIDENLIRYEEIRNIYTNLESKEVSQFSDISKGSFDKSLASTADRIQGDLLIYKNYQDEQKSLNSGLPPISYPLGYGGGMIAYVIPKANVNSASFNFDSYGDINSIDYFFGEGIDSVSRVYIPNQITSADRKITLNSGEYFLGTKKVEGGSNQVISAYRINGKDNNGKLILGEQVPAEQVQLFGTISSADSVSYRNKILNPEVKYYETEPYKGMPAVVPFDIQNGWYAGTKQTLPVFGGIGAFDASGRVSSFWLCNVGKNGLIDFESGLNDDICQQFNLNTGQPLNKFSVLREAETRRLVDKAVSAIEEAARQYSSGNSFIRIGGSDIKRGRPMSNKPETKCQDFMSPKECQLMFNVCDPVICPATRCDFGGRYPVSDVIQSGIIGSTLLCLPNAKEGIYMPVCLSGIHAGIDNYVSILKAHRDCLQENIKTGQMTGICDQIYSIYSCEFFWRQLAPLSRVVVPKMFEYAYGQGARGGGEYLSVQAAWKNTQNSINYFTQVYGVNSFKAFQLRNVEEAGGEFCKAFISAKAPTSFKSLTAPDSPVQFTAYFSSTRYSDATIPATAQYKVFYHIYAGKDTGVSFRVYLKSPPDTGYYSANPSIPVATGFVGRGQYIDQTRDFTAPEGYQQLCVNINGEEKCGFKQVSTSFAVNALRDEVIKGENGLTDSNINSEKDCVSGSINAAALLNPNLQQAADEALSPDIYRRGIIRICATNNPGSSTDPTRFVRVGNCGSENIGCWLDQKSVQNAITDNNKGVRNETLEKLKGIQKDNLIADKKILNDNDAQVTLKGFQSEVNGFDEFEKLTDKNKIIAGAVSLLNRIGFIEQQDLLFLNPDKARLLYIKGQVYETLAKIAFGSSNAISQQPQQTLGLGQDNGKSPEPLTDNRDIPKEPETGTPVPGEVIGASSDSSSPLQTTQTNFPAEDKPSEKYYKIERNLTKNITKSEKNIFLLDKNTGEKISPNPFYLMPSKISKSEGNIKVYNIKIKYSIFRPQDRTWIDEEIGKIIADDEGNWEIRINDRGAIAKDTLQRYSGILDEIDKANVFGDVIIKSVGVVGEPIAAH